MAKSIKDIFRELGAEYVCDLPDVGGGTFGAAHLAKILEERLQPGKGKRPGRPTDPRWRYRHRHVPMTEESLKKLEVLVERINRHSERRVSKTQVAAVLLEKAIAGALTKSDKTA